MGEGTSPNSLWVSVWAIEPVCLIANKDAANEASPRGTTSPCPFKLFGNKKTNTSLCAI